MRILFIDDDPGIQTIADLALERVGGFQVRLCGSGKEALIAAPEFMPDIVLLDVTMPDMDGIGTLKELRKIPQTADIPVVFLTANTQPEDIIGYKELGAIDVFSKPFDPMKLSEEVSAILKHHKSRGKANITEKFKELHEQYAEQIPFKIRQIKDCWNSLTKDFISKAPSPSPSPSRGEGCNISPPFRGGDEGEGDVCNLTNDHISKSGNFDEKVLRNLHLLVHSLSGSGDTFGFPAISFAANRLELLLKDVINGKVSLTEDLSSKITGLLENLKESGEKPGKPGYLIKPIINSEAAETLTKQSSESRLVLLLGNGPFLINELSPQLGYFGYTIKTLLNPEGLLKALGDTLPSSIIADITSAEDKAACMESITAARETASFSIPIIFISDNDDIDIHLQSVRIGGEAYFTKPVDISRLIDKLDSFTSPLLKEPYRVLIVDDEPVLASQHELILQQSDMITAVVTEPLQLMQKLTEFRPELILMDMYMPECSGMELAKMIRQKEAFVSIPIVFLSSEKDIEKQLNAMSLGGDDFLTKPIKAGHLISSIATRIERSRILRSFMIRDSLTGLLNHTRTTEQLNIEISRIQRTNSRLVFAMIDIDHFKLVNDTYGHITGDQVIKSLSRLLQQRLRKTDTVGRYGGEEFAVILNNMEGATAVKILDEIREDFAKIQHNFKGRKFSVTFSCGVATFPIFNNSFQLTEAADNALYEAKHKGRNRVILARE